MVMRDTARIKFFGVRWTRTAALACLYRRGKPLGQGSKDWPHRGHVFRTGRATAHFTPRDQKPAVIEDRLLSDHAFETLPNATQNGGSS